MKNPKLQVGLLGVVSIMAITAFITVAWAAFSSSLSIEGSATVEKMSWSIGFYGDDSSTTTSYPMVLNDDDHMTLTGTATNSASSETALRFESADKITGTIGVLNQPGDKITYSGIYVNNYGTFDATISFEGLLSTKLTNGTNVKLTCTSKDTSKFSDDEAKNFCESYVVATLKYGDTLPLADTTFSLSKYSGDSSSKEFTLTFEYLYSESTSALAAADIKIELNTISIKATQV